MQGYYIMRKLNHVTHYTYRKGDENHDDERIFDKFQYPFQILKTPNS